MGEGALIPEGVASGCASTYSQCMEHRNSLSPKGQVVTSREVEAALLARCAAVARDVSSMARDQREANVFRLAAMVVQQRFPCESMNLMRASEQYFGIHPSERMAPGEIVRSGWIVLCKAQSF